MNQQMLDGNSLYEKQHDEEVMARGEVREVKCLNVKSLLNSENFLCEAIDTLNDEGTLHHLFSIILKETGICTEAKSWLTEKLESMAEDQIKYVEVFKTESQITDFVDNSMDYQKSLMVLSDHRT